MDYLLMYVNLVRAILIILAIYHIYKHDYKSCKSIAIAFLVTFLPGLFDRYFSIKIDAVGIFLYISLIFMTMYLGNIQRFYDKYRWWDMLTHFISGIVFVSFGIGLSKKFGFTNNFVILFFCFTFSTTLNVFWEVLEYISDCFLKTNTQRWKENTPSKKPGSKQPQPAGLLDTMNDLILCIVSTLISCIIWWFILKS